MNTKTRYTSAGETTARNSVYGFFYANGTRYLTVPYSDPSIIPHGSLSETISSTNSPERQVNECTHERVSNKILPCLCTDRIQYGGTDYLEKDSGDRTMWDFAQWACPVLGLSSVSVTYPKTPAQLLEEARQAFFDGNETDNLLNILEAGQTVSSLVQFGSLLNRLKDQSGQLKDLARSTKVAYHAGKRVDWKDVSNMYLGWSFGFAPLIADAKKIAPQLPKLRKNLLQLAKNSAKPHAVTRQCQGDSSLALPSYGLIPSGQDPQPWQWWNASKNDVVRPVLTAGVFGQRNVKYKTDEFQILDYLLGKYVATGPVSLAWEKIKFSFAVDWFANVTGIVDRLDNALTGNTKQVTRAWTSEKWQMHVPIIYRGGGPSASVRMPQFIDQEVASYDILKYHRQPATLDYSVKWSGRFGKKQGSLSIALLHQYVANLKRK